MLELRKYFHVTKPSSLTLGHSDPVVSSGRMRRKYVQCSRHLACSSISSHDLQPMSYCPYYSLITNLLHCDTSPAFTKSAVISIIPIVTLIGYLDKSA